MHSYRANGIDVGVILLILYINGEIDSLWRSGEELEYIVPKGLASLIVRVDEALVELLGWSVAGSSMQQIPGRHI